MIMGIEYLIIPSRLVVVVVVVDASPMLQWEIEQKNWGNHVNDMVNMIGNDTI